MSRLSVVEVFLTNLFLPYEAAGLDTCCPVEKKRLRSYVMYIPFCVKRTFKFQLGTHKDGTFPFDSSFIKVETDLMCIRRNFPFMFYHQLKLL